MVDDGDFAHEQRGVGKPLHVYETDPLLLEVHRAIDLGPLTDGMPGLPVYVPRPHDRDLADAVARAIGGSSALVTLVGGSSTGKTRACWEAVRELGRGWRLWHPVSPGRVEALLDGIDRVGPRTVIWLNEVQHYVGPPGAGEEAAARLRGLLADPARGPVLVLATLWPRHWRQLTADPADGGADPHAQARDLLADSAIEVPDAFGPSALLALRRAAAEDPRLAWAAADADRGQITQYLAGVPALLTAYRTASPTVKALVHAAMDARRLGAFEEWIPVEFLRDAAPGYLTDLQWLEAGDGDDWLREALDQAARPCKGVLGPLSPRKSRTTKTAGGQPVPRRLADYLEQLGRSERVAALPPESFWEAAVAHADTGRLAALAGEAQRRGLYRLSARMLRTALSAGAASGAGRLAAVVASASARTAGEAMAWIVRNANVSDSSEVARLIRFLQEERADELIRELIKRTVAETSFCDVSALDVLLDVLTEFGDDEDVRVLLARDPASQVVLNDLPDAYRLLAKMKVLGAHDQFETLADRMATSDVSELSYLALVFLHEARAERQLAKATDRACAQLDGLDPPEAVMLLRALIRVGDHRHIERVLGLDLVSGVPLDDAVGGLKVLYDAGAERHLSEVIGRLNAHAQTADVAWTARLYMMAEELQLHDELVARLPFRLPEDRLDLTDADTVVWLLSAARRLGTEQRLAALITRSAARPYSFRSADELEALRDILEWEAGDLVAEVTRAVAEWLPAGDAGMTAWVLRTLSEYDMDASVRTLLGRCPAVDVGLDDPEHLAQLLAQLRRLGAHGEIATLRGRGMGTAVPLDRAEGTADLLYELAECGEGELVSQVAARAVRECDVTDVDAAVRLMDAVDALCPREQPVALADRVAAEADVTSPGAAYVLLAYFMDHDLASAFRRVLIEIEAQVATKGTVFTRAHRYDLMGLLQLLKAARASRAISALATRLVAAADFSRPGTTADVAAAMREAGALDQVDMLAATAADSGEFLLALDIAPDLREAYPFGREPDGAPSRPWGWHDL